MPQNTRQIDDLNTFDALLAELNTDGSSEAFDLQFSSDLLTLKIAIEGENYNSSLTASSMEGLVALQKAIFRAYSIVAYKQANYKKLTQPQKDQLTLVFEVSKGSTNVEGTIASIIEAVKELCKDMDSKTKAIVICTIVAFLCTTYAAVTINEAHQNTQVQINENDKELQLEKERTKQMELMLQKSPQASNIKDVIQQGVTEFLQGVSDAEKVSISGGVIPKEVISSINERSSRRKAHEENIRSKYSITRIDIPTGTEQKFEIRDVHTEETFVVSLDIDLSTEDLEKIWTHAKSSRSIDLQLTLSKIGESVKSGVIVAVLGPRNESA